MPNYNLPLESLRAAPNNDTDRLLFALVERIEALVEEMADIRQAIEEVTRK